MQNGGQGASRALSQAGQPGWDQGWQSCRPAGRWISACGILLGSAGTEFIFFIVACLGLCSGFVLKAIDNTGMFSLLLSSAHKEPRPLLLLTHQSGGAQEVGRGHSQDSQPQLTKGTFHAVWHRTQKEKWGGRRGAGALLTEWVGIGQLVVATALICITCLSWVLFLSLLFSISLQY